MYGCYFTTALALRAKSSLHTRLPVGHEIDHHHQQHHHGYCCCCCSFGIPRSRFNYSYYLGFQSSLINCSSKPSGRFIFPASTVATSNRLASFWDILEVLADFQGHSRNHIGFSEKNWEVDDEQLQRRDRRSRRRCGRRERHLQKKTDWSSSGSECYSEDDSPLSGDVELDYGRSRRYSGRFRCRCRSRSRKCDDDLRSERRDRRRRGGNVGVSSSRQIYEREDGDLEEYDKDLAGGSNQKVRHDHAREEHSDRRNGNWRVGRMDSIYDDDGVERVCRRTDSAYDGRDYYSGESRNLLEDLRWKYNKDHAREAQRESRNGYRTMTRVNELYDDDAKRVRRRRDSVYDGREDYSGELRHVRDQRDSRERSRNGIKISEVHEDDRRALKSRIYDQEVRDGYTKGEQGLSEQRRLREDSLDVARTSEINEDYRKSNLWRRASAQEAREEQINERLTSGRRDSCEASQSVTKTSKVLRDDSKRFTRLRDSTQEQKDVYTHEEQLDLAKRDSEPISQKSAEMLEVHEAHTQRAANTTDVLNSAMVNKQASSTYAVGSSKDCRIVGERSSSWDHTNISEISDSHVKSASVSHARFEEARVEEKEDTLVQVTRDRRMRLNIQEIEDIDVNLQFEKLANLTASQVNDIKQMSSQGTRMDDQKHHISAVSQVPDGNEYRKQTSMQLITQQTPINESARYKDQLQMSRSNDDRISKSQQTFSTRVEDQEEYPIPALCPDKAEQETINTGGTSKTSAPNTGSHSLAYAESRESRASRNKGVGSSSVCASRSATALSQLPSRNIGRPSNSKETFIKSLEEKGQSSLPALAQDNIMEESNKSPFELRETGPASNTTLSSSDSGEAQIAIASSLHGGSSSLPAIRSNVGDQVSTDDLYIMKDDMLGSASRSEKSSAQHLNEFVEKMRHELSSSGEVNSALKQYAGTPLKEIQGETSESSNSQLGSHVAKVKHKDDNSVQDTGRQSSYRSAPKGPSDEMWDVKGLSVEESSRKEESKEKQFLEKDSSSTSTGTETAIAGRGQKSLWTYIAETIRNSLRVKAGMQNSTQRSGTKSSSNDSVDSEVWFSGHEPEENDDVINQGETTLPEVLPSKSQSNLLQSYKEGSKAVGDNSIQLSKGGKSTSLSSRRGVLSKGSSPRGPKDEVELLEASASTLINPTRSGRSSEDASGVSGSGHLYGSETEMGMEIIPPDVASLGHSALLTASTLSASANEERAEVDTPELASSKFDVVPPAVASVGQSALVTGGTPSVSSMEITNVEIPEFACTNLAVDPPVITSVGQSPLVTGSVPTASATGELAEVQSPDFADVFAPGVVSVHHPVSVTGSTPSASATEDIAEIETPEFASAKSEDNFKEKLPELSESDAKAGELKQRKLQRNKQVMRETFDEWEEAYQKESEQRKLDEYFMREALLEAKKAADMWEVPVGAILVMNGKIIARGCNLVEELRDSTAHAEMMCIREASNLLRTWRLAETTLYVTLEPCPMCAGAILQARIDAVVWGAPNKLLGADGSWVRLFPGNEGSDLDSSNQTTGPVHPFHPNIKIRRGVLATECADAMQRFFQLRRKKEKKPKQTTSHLPITTDRNKLFTRMHNLFCVMFCL